MKEAMTQEDDKGEEDMVQEIVTMMNIPRPEHLVKEKEIHFKEKRDQEIILHRFRMILEEQVLYPEILQRQQIY